LLRLNGKANLVAGFKRHAVRNPDIDSSWSLGACHQTGPAASPGRAAFAGNWLVHDYSGYTVVNGLYATLCGFHEFFITDGRPESRPWN
jgi:hypothetical protein